MTLSLLYSNIWIVMERIVTASRIPMAFHETFSLKRNAVAQVLNALAAVRDEKILGSKKQRESLLRESTSLGANYVKSVPSYARGSGLLDDNYRTSIFGNYVLRHDESLEHVGTQWLMHYHLSAPQGPGPEFWSRFVVEHFRTGNYFSKEQLTQELKQFHFGVTGKELGEGSATSTPRVFLGTYTSSDGLGRLHLLSSAADGFYRVLEPVAIPIWALAYALMDYWETFHPGQLSINLDSLTSEQGLANLFLLDQATLERLLNELQRTGVVEVYRSAQPFQLLLLSQDRELVLGKLYGVDEEDE